VNLAALAAGTDMEAIYSPEDGHTDFVRSEKRKLAALTQ